MTTQHYRGYDIEVCCMHSNSRYAWTVAISAPLPNGVRHDYASPPEHCGDAAQAQDLAFQYARAWVALHPLHWPFAGPG